LTGTPDEIIDDTPTYLNVYAPEVSVDFQNQTRPGLGLSDKGADEL